MLKRRGGQPGNQNAVKHGRHSAAKRAERREAAEEQHRRALHSIEPPRPDEIATGIRYASVDEYRAARAEQVAA
jgi:hypothetical protein